MASLIDNHDTTLGSNSQKPMDFGSRYEVSDAFHLIEYVNQNSPFKFEPGTLSPIVEPNFKVDMADSPSKFLVDSSDLLHNGVLVISNRHSPNLAGQFASKTREVKRVLPAGLGEVILDPVFTGRFDGLSFVIWPRHSPLSDLRLVRAIQKRLLSPIILRWLKDITKHTATCHTAQDKFHLDFIEALKYISSEEQLPQKIREKSEEAMERVQSQELLPISVLQHSDFWLGNILVHKDGIRLSARDRSDFFIIDWGGALIEGYPFFDLARYCLSCGVRGKAATSQFLHHSEILGCSPDDAEYYALAALGILGMNLGSFTKTRYVRLSQDIWGFLERVKETRR